MKPLRVAIDARMAENSGIGRYVRGLADALARLDPPVEVRRLDRASGLTAPIYGLREQIDVPCAFRRLDPPADLLHVPHYNAPLFARVPLVVTVHDLIHLKLPELSRRAGARIYARFVLPRAVRRARAVLCDSEATRRDLLALAPDVAGKTRVVHPGCDLRAPSMQARDAALARLALAPGYLLYLGNVRAHKGVDGLARAYSRLPVETRPPLVLAGDDQMPAAWPARNSPGVRILGPVEDADLPALYAGALAFVFPSLYEGFGLPPLEAMACGTPVVSSDGGSLPEVTGDAALTYRAGDEGALEQALRAIIAEPARRKDLRARGLERAKMFTWEKTALGARAAYEAALSVEGARDGK